MAKQEETKRQNSFEKKEKFECSANFNPYNMPS